MKSQGRSPKKVYGKTKAQQPGVSNSFHERPPSCISLKSLKGYMPKRAMDNIAFDRRNISLGSTISQKTQPMEFLRLQGNASESKDSSGGDGQKNAGGHSDDDRIFLTKKPFGTGSLGGSDSLQENDSIGIERQMPAVDGTVSGDATLELKQQDKVSDEMMQTIIQQQMHIEQYQNCVQELQGELTRCKSENKMYQLRLAAM